MQVAAAFEADVGDKLASVDVLLQHDDGSLALKQQLMGQAKLLQFCAQATQLAAQTVTALALAQRFSSYLPGPVSLFYVSCQRFNRPPRTRART